MAGGWGGGSNSDGCVGSVSDGLEGSLLVFVIVV